MTSRTLPRSGYPLLLLCACILGCSGNAGSDQHAARLDPNAPNGVESRANNALPNSAREEARPEVVASAHSAMPHPWEVTPQDIASTYMLTHVVTPLAGSIAKGGSLDLSKDTECLLLLDNMLNGSDRETRNFYFWVVSKTLSSADGYYAEGLGNMATAYLFERPSEFLHVWFYWTSPHERNEWASSLASEQAIVSEGYACDTVMSVFRARLYNAIPTAEKELIPTGDLLVTKVDSVLRLLKANEQ